MTDQEHEGVTVDIIDLPERFVAAGNQIIPLGAVTRYVKESDYAAITKERDDMKRDIETGFMSGAYARLQNLQQSERALHDLKQAACSRELLHAVEVRDLRREIEALKAQLKH